jgi:hypothetical protein
MADKSALDLASWAERCFVALSKTERSSRRVSRVICLFILLYLGAPNYEHEIDRTRRYGEVDREESIGE